MRPYLVFFFSVAILFLLAAPVTFAQGPFDTILDSNFSIVPQECGTTATAECNICNFAKLVNNLSTFLVYFATVITALLVMWAGFKYMTAADNPGQIKEAHQILWNVVIGFVFLLGSWVIVDTIMKAFLKSGGGFDGAVQVNNEWGPWNNIICPPTFRPSVGQTPAGGVTIQPSTGGSQTATCEGCEAVQNLAECKNGNCSLSSAIAADASSFAKALGDLRMTEGYPPTSNHCANCHYGGTCFDATSANNDYSTANIKRWRDSANQTGFKLVLESADCSLKQKALDAGVQAKCKGQDPGYDHITGTHYSVYDIDLGSGGSRCQ